MQSSAESSSALCQTQRAVKRNTLHRWQGRTFLHTAAAEPGPTSALRCGTQPGSVTDTDNLGGMSKALHTLIVSEDILGCTEDIGLPNNLSEASLCDPLCDTVLYLSVVVQSNAELNSILQRFPLMLYCYYP